MLCNSENTDDYLIFIRLYSCIPKFLYFFISLIKSFVIKLLQAGGGRVKYPPDWENIWDRKKKENEARYCIPLTQSFMQGNLLSGELGRETTQMLCICSILHQGRP